MAQPDLAQQRANIRARLEKKINGVIVAEIFNPDTNRRFTDQELDDFINDSTKFRGLFGSGIGVKKTGP